jgi:hypothetical protein
MWPPEFIASVTETDVYIFEEGKNHKKKTLELIK